MLVKLLKEIINDRIQTHNFFKVVDKTYSERGFVVEGKIDDFYVKNNNYSPIKSVADCSKFEIWKDKVYLEKFQQLGSREEHKTCLIFEIDIDNLEATEY